MPKIDLRRELKPLYTASSKKAALVDVPRMKFLMVDGSGHPDGNPLFQQGMEALFGVAYTLKFSSKLGPQKLDWTMMPPEGVWWVESLREGRCVQILHIGPYDAEQPAIEKLLAFAAENGCKVTGKHHEIYFSDPRRAKPEKLKTVIRLAVSKRV